MVKLAVTIVLLGLLACGSGDTGGGAGADAPPVSSGSAAGAPEAPESAAVAGAEVDPQHESCLRLLRELRFQQALPVCTAALEANPASEELREAVERAEMETAKLAEAAEAAAMAGSADAEAMEEKAASKLDEATGGMKVGQ